jgi:ATP-dependent Clp protease ATP-binding subunit ClpB
MVDSCLLAGEDVLAGRPNFKLVGRAEALKRLSAILMRSHANSVLLFGPGGVGCSSLVYGLQASKADPDTPFDIVSKRMFFLDTDKLFSSGDTQQINAMWRQIMERLERTPSSVLVIEDTRDFIEAARNSGCMHFINGLTFAVKNGRTQAILEARDEDLEAVLKCHSDLRECYTMMDLEEPTGQDLEMIVDSGTAGLEKHHRIRVHQDARRAAIELTNKYRTKDAGLSRAQPERAVTLIDRALSTYRLEAHGAPIGLRTLSNRLARAQTDAERDAIAHEIRLLREDWQAKQDKLRQFYELERRAEAQLLELENELLRIKKEEKDREPPLAPSGMDEAATRSHALRQRLVAGFDSPEVTRVRSHISRCQEIIDENKKRFLEIAQTIDAELELRRDHVLTEFSRISGISANKLNEDEREKLRNLEEGLRSRIYGQDRVLTQVANGIKVARLGKRSKGKPLAYLFLGPSGVGKTELAKALAALLFDSEEALARFDMSEYMEKHGVAKMIGAPPGYEGFEAGGILTNMMRRNPNRAILFDEIEKAHPDIYNIFLQILGDGRLTDNIGRTVQFGDAIIIMTTNIGQAHFLGLDFAEGEKAAILELNGTYRNEFLNRFAGRRNIICFNRLDLESMQKIVKREINNIDMTYRDQGITTVMSDEAIAEFSADHYDPAEGARGLPGYIQVNLEPIIVNGLLDNPDVTGTLRVGYDKAKKSFTSELVTVPHGRSAA